jgi:stage II sporulation protein D
MRTSFPQPSTATRRPIRRSLSVRKVVPLVALIVLACAPSAQAASRLVIRGAGFGHGIGMSQYGAYGLALQGVGYQAILGRYYTGTQLAQVASEPEVRVLLQGGRRKYTFTGAARLGTQALDPSKIYNVIRGGSGLVLRDGSKKLFTSAPPLRVDAGGGGALLLNGTSVPGIRDGRYRGAFEFRPSGSGISAINALGLESYVRGVVSAESPSAWPAEALRAQAVAARTYAITSRAGSISQGFDQFADTRSQMYKGVAAETPNTDAAVNATAGQVVTYGGQPVTTYFFSTSGGHTESVENSFVGSAPKPWLKGVDDPYDDLSPKHRWKPITLTTKQATAKLRGLVRGSFERLDVLQRGTSPRIVKAQIVGSKGTTPVTGPQLRARFGLWDTWAFFTTISSNGKRAPLGPETPNTPGAPITPAGGTAPTATTPPTGGTPSGGVTAGAATVRAVSAGGGASAARPAPRASHRTGPVLSGRIQPAKAGARIRVERRVGKTWVLAVDAQLAPGGRYAVAVPGAGVYRVRYADAVVGPDVRVH